jgi:anti-sigma regulatory factor (Ser/Thr protein kinase)
MDVADRLTLHNRREDLVALSAWLGEFSARHALPARAAFRLELVLTEAVTNVIEYAHPEEAGHPIELRCSCRDGVISMELRDDGPPFDPTAHAVPMPATDLASARPGGLGIRLMREYTQEMRYRRVKGRNVLAMSLPVDS